MCDEDGVGILRGEVEGRLFGNFGGLFNNEDNSQVFLRFWLGSTEVFLV